MVGGGGGGGDGEGGGERERERERREHIALVIWLDSVCLACVSWHMLLYTLVKIV